MLALTPARPPVAVYRRCEAVDQRRRTRPQLACRTSAPGPGARVAGVRADTRFARYGSSLDRPLTRRSASRWASSSACSPRAALIAPPAGDMIGGVAERHRPQEAAETTGRAPWFSGARLPGDVLVALPIWAPRCGSGGLEPPPGNRGASSRSKRSRYPPSRSATAHSHPPRAKPVNASTPRFTR
jgi:hypothetical protein